ncbi:MAG: hypothetical protein GY761_22040 [Hyphomicrobiales bacterium]|nr:hypothetical protein [Hyphomicrobiales bacterium]
MKELSVLDSLLSSILVSNILALPWFFKYPGLLILGLLAYRALRSVVAVDAVKVVTSITIFFLFAYVLARFGDSFAKLLLRLIG